MWKNKIKKAKLAEPASPEEQSDSTEIENGSSSHEQNEQRNGEANHVAVDPEDIIHNHGHDREAKRLRSDEENGGDTADNSSDGSNKRSRGNPDGVDSYMDKYDPTESTPLHFQYESRSSKASKRDQNWDLQFEALLAYANKHKHCNVRTGYTISDEDKPHVNLYAWLALQRRHKKQNKLRPDREKKLQSLVDAGMLSWSGNETNLRADDEEEYIHVLPPPPPPSWESHFAEVLIYAEIHGHANVPMGYLVPVDKRKDIDLGLWLEEQRKQHGRKLPDSANNAYKLNILADEGRFSWQTPRVTASVPPHILEMKWSFRFEAMRNYISQEENRGVCLGDNIRASLVVPIPDKPGGQHGAVEVFDLGLWILAQRKAYAGGVLDDRRKGLLQMLVDSNQFTWQSKEEAARLSAEDAKRSKEEEALWNAWYNALVWQGNHVGHCNLDSHGTITLPDGSEAELGKWLHIQRVHIKKGRLRLDRAKKIKVLYDEGKLHPSRWAHVFTLKYPPTSFDDTSTISTSSMQAISPSSLHSTESSSPARLNS